MNVISPQDFRERACRRLPRMLFEYVEGAAGTEETCQRNGSDLRAVPLAQRVMRDVSAISLDTAFLGRSATMPVVLGPVGLAGIFSRRGEVAAARAAAMAGIPFSLSMSSVCTIEEVASDSRHPFWFQLYMLRDRGFVAELLTRARDAGCDALILTVDLPMPGMRYRDFKTGMAGPPGWRGSVLRVASALHRPQWLWDVGLMGRPHSLGNIAAQMRGAKAMGDFLEWILANYDPRITWADLEFVRRHWSGPIIIKGLLEASDAVLAIEHGADALVVSNHGGRQLDGAQSTASALPAVVTAVDRRVPVFVDGGAYTGSDVVRFLSLGADAIFLGRAWAHALAAGGEGGVTELLERIRREITLALAFTGANGPGRGQE